MTGFVRAMAAAIARLFADKAARSATIAAILIYSVFYPQPYTAEVVRNVPVAVVDQDGSTASRELTRRIDAAEGARVMAAVPDLPAAEALYFGRRVSGVVIIPPDFERDLLNGTAAPVAAFGDASYFMVYSTMMAAVGGAARGLGAEVQIARLTATGTDPGTAAVLVTPVSVASVALFNPQGGYASYVVPAAFVLILQQTLLMGIGILHAGRPAARGMAMIATPLAYICLYSLWIAVTQLALPHVYGIARTGSWWHLYAVAVPFLAAVTAMGFALARLFPRREAMMFFLLVMGLPLFFLSGVSWPADSIPAPVHAVAALIPSTSAITAIVRVDQMGADLSAVADTVWLQLALAAGYGGIAAALGRRRGGRLRPGGSGRRTG